MKIYTDKMPKSCLVCNFDMCEHQFVECMLGCRHSDCPLKSLAEHDAEKDKCIAELEEELAFEVSKNLIQQNMPAYCRLAGRDCEYMGKVKELEAIKSRWEKLERYITDKHNVEEENAVAMTDILLKMQELKKESEDEE